MFEAGALALFTGCYPDRPCLLDHGLVAHPLLSLPRLTVLAGSLPKMDVIYRSADLTADQYSETLDLENQAPAALVQGLGTSRTLLQLTDIGEEREYKALTMDILRPFRPLLKASGAPAIGAKTHIHLASPKAILPFHLETAHQLYLQVRGTSILSLHDGTDPDIVPGAAFEGAYARGEVGLPYQDDFADRAAAYELNEGTAVYLPPGSPYWLEHGPDISLGLSLRWQSRVSFELADCYQMHGRLRRFGWAQGPTKGGWARRMKARAYGWMGSGKK